MTHLPHLSKVELSSIISATFETLDTYHAQFATYMCQKLRALCLATFDTFDICRGIIITTLDIFNTYCAQLLTLSATFAHLTIDKFDTSKVALCSIISATFDTFDTFDT